VTEVGRQPWVVYRLQTTAAAATTNGGVITSLSIIIAGDAVLGAATILILRMLARRWRRTDALETAVPSRPPPRPARPAAGPPGQPARSRAGRGRDGRRRRRDPAGLDHAVRRAGRGRLRRRPVGPAGGRRHPGAAAPHADRRVDHPGVGGQPRLARL